MSNSTIELTQKILEINNTCIQMILEEKLSTSLELLTEANNILEQYSNQIKESKLNVIINHNIACCYQKLKNIPKCIIYLEKVNELFNKYLENKHKILINTSFFLEKILNNNVQSNILLGDFILELRFCAKFHLQMCAAYSQNNNHIEALNHAKLAALICEDNIVKTYLLLKQIKEEILLDNNNNQNNKKYSKIFCEKINENEPIITSLYQSINEYAINYKNGKNINNEIYTKEQILNFIKNDKMKVSTRNILGIIKNDDWLNLFNIGNIMFLYAMSYDDLDLDSDPKYELLRDAIIEKILMFTVSYFSIANELRFLNNKNDNGTYYHSKAVEISCLFLPSSCPIVKHYVNTYYKYYANNIQIDLDKDCKKNETFDITKDKILYFGENNIINITEINYMKNVSPNEAILPLNNNKSESEIQLQAKTERKNEINNKLSLTGRGSKINWKSSNGKNYKIEKKIRDNSNHHNKNNNKNNINEKYNFNQNLLAFNNFKKEKSKDKKEYTPEFFSYKKMMK